MSNERMFKIEINQVAWNTFKDTRDGDKTDKNIMMATRQYKPILIKLEEYTNKSFDQITVCEIEAFLLEGTNMTKKNHINGFYMATATAGIFKFSKDILAWMMPTQYKEIVSLLLK